MIGSKHELDKIVGVQVRKQRQSKFSVAEHRTNPCIQQGGQRECGVCTRWDCFHHEEQGAFAGEWMQLETVIVNWASLGQTDHVLTPLWFLDFTWVHKSSV